MTSDGSRRHRAQEAVDRVQDDPAAALDAARAVLDELDGLLAGAAGPAAAPVADETGTRATARWAAGLALRELGGLEEAGKELDAAATLAAEVGLDELEGNITSSLMLVLAYQGDTAAALARADRAEQVLNGAALARVRMQRALVHQRLGRLEEAVAAYDAALEVFESEGDRTAEVRLRVNRGVANGYLGRFDEAVQDLERARALASADGQRLQVAVCAHNLGFVAGRRGDVPAALDWFDRAARELASLAPEALGTVAFDRAEVLLGAGLTAEALEDARRSLELLDASQNAFERAEARLVLARAALGEHQLDLAREQARKATAELSAQARPGWVVRAQYLEFEAERGVPVGRLVQAVQAAMSTTAGGGTEPPMQPTPAGPLDMAERLAAHGWVTEAAAVRLRLAREAMVERDPAGARAVLAPVRTLHPSSPLGHAQRAHAESLHALCGGDRIGALAAVERGLEAVAAHRARLGATDLRARATGIGSELAALALALRSLETDPWGLFEAAEAFRAATLASPTRQTDDRTLTDLLGQARALEAEQARALADGVDPTLARGRLRVVEARIRDRARTGPGRGSGPVEVGPPELVRERLLARLGDRTLVEWIVLDGRLEALVLREGNLERVACGPLGPVEAEIRAARMDLQRLASRARSTDARSRALDGFEATTLRLEAMLAPWDDPTPGDVVVVPTGVLHAVPWAALPRWRGRAVSVAPSATLWSRPDEPVDLASARVLVVAGPDLPGARAEAEAVAETWPGAVVLADAEAVVGAVLDGLGPASIAHVAAHGRFRADSPLFSSLSMADGRLTVYDLERHGAVPEVFVLSACEIGGSAVHPGDELVGVAAALIGSGARTVIAPGVPVPDQATVELMTALHHGLRDGLAPARALAGATATVRGAGRHPEAVAAAAAFVCLEA